MIQFRLRAWMINHQSTSSCRMVIWCLTINTENVYRLTIKSFNSGVRIVVCMQRFGSIIAYPIPLCILYDSTNCNDLHVVSIRPETWQSIALISLTPRRRRPRFNLGLVCIFMHVVGEYIYLVLGQIWKFDMSRLALVQTGRINCYEY